MMDNRTLETSQTGLEEASLRDISAPAVLDRSLGRIISFMQRFSELTDRENPEAASRAAERCFAELAGIDIAFGKTAYRIENFLGAGAAGVVVSASHKHGTAAIKFTEPFPTESEKADDHGCDFVQEDFENERKVLSRLKKAGVEGVPELFGVAILREPREQLSVGVIAMEQLPGVELDGSVNEMLADKALHPKLFEIFAKAFSIADSCTAAGVVMCDFTPKNILVAEEGEGTRVSLIDFGNAELSDDAVEEGPAVIARTWEQLLTAWDRTARVNKSKAELAAVDAIGEVLLPFIDGESSLKETARGFRQLAEDAGRKLK